MQLRRSLQLPPPDGQLVRLTYGESWGHWTEVAPTPMIEEGLFQEYVESGNLRTVKAPVSACGGLTPGLPNFLCPPVESLRVLGISMHPQGAQKQNSFPLVFLSALGTSLDPVSAAGKPPEERRSPHGAGRANRMASTPGTRERLRPRPPGESQTSWSSVVGGPVAVSE